ncbi:MAG: lipopolysaccharide assembly protein LapA domain-containing protein [Silanimonas sp.]
MRLIRVLLAFLCVAFGIGVAALNGEAVRLDLLWVEFTLPLGLLLLGVLLLGALLGGIAALLSRLTPQRVATDASDDEAAIG